MVGKSYITTFLFFPVAFPIRPFSILGRLWPKRVLSFFSFLFSLFSFLRYELEGEAEADTVAPAVGRDVVAVSHTTVPRVVEPTTPTKHAVRGR